MGVLLWIVAGLAVVALSSLVTSWGWFRPRWRSLVALGVTGAVVGGLLATGFGFGGLLALDPRAAISAALGALAGVLGGTLMVSVADSVR
jgi:hypothetical protein